MIPDEEIPEGSDVLKVMEPWCSMILSGRKVKEIRGSRTLKRGWIYISPSGSPNIVGRVRVDDCSSIQNVNEWVAQANEHCVADKKLPYAKTFAWHLSEAGRFETPVPHKAPRGCVVWSHFVHEQR